VKLAHAAVLIACCAGPLLACDGELPLFLRAPAGADAGTSPAAGGASTLGGATFSSGGLNASGDGNGNTAGVAGGPSGSLLIDDLEDGDSRADGFGWWYPTNDRTSSQGWGFEPVSDRENSKLAVRTHGNGFTNWGAILGVTLRESGPLDASQYGTLQFWARAQPGSVPEMLAQVVDVAGGPFSAQVTLSEAWTEYRIAFGSFRSQTDAQLDPTQLLAVQFLFSPHQSFDVWFDDLAFGP
jgi:hypothetical protein